MAKMIDADQALAMVHDIGECLKLGNREMAGAAFMIHKRLCELPSVEAIPVAIMEREIAGIGAADQCDQAGRNDYELRDALRKVLKWYQSPRYEELARRSHGQVQV